MPFYDDTCHTITTMTRAYIRNLVDSGMFAEELQYEDLWQDLGKEAWIDDIKSVGGSVVDADDTSAYYNWLTRQPAYERYVDRVVRSIAEGISNVNFTEV